MVAASWRIWRVTSNWKVNSCAFVILQHYVEIMPMHCCRSFMVLVVQVTFLILKYHALKVALEEHWIKVQGGSPKVLSILKVLKVREDAAILVVLGTTHGTCNHNQALYLSLWLSFAKSHHISPNSQAEPTCRLLLSPPGLPYCSHGYFHDITTMTWQYYKSNRTDAYLH